jgi:hypothetical protein
MAAAYNSLRRASKEMLEGPTETETSFRPVPQDMWGITLVEIVSDLADVTNLSLAKGLRLFFSVVAMGINLWLQFCILYYVNQFIVGQAVHTTQSNYKQFRKEVFHEDGTFDSGAWKEWKGPYMELCNMAVSKVGFTFAIVFLWSGRMIGEVRTVERLHRDVHSIEKLPPTKKASDMVEEIRNDAGEDEYHIVHLATWTRVLIYVLVIIPKCLIACILMFIGCRWLAATESFADLILNALALEFVIDIDEFMYEKFAPEVMRERTGKFSITHVRPAILADGEDIGDIKAYLRSLGYLLVAGVWSIAYMKKFQQVLPGFDGDVNAHCGGWFSDLYKPICPPFSDPNTCFPYGGSG